MASAVVAKFHLMESISKLNIKKTAKRTLTHSETWKSLSRSLCSAFGTSALVLIDQNGDRVQFNPKHLETEYYVTENACTTTRTGFPSYDSHLTIPFSLSSVLTPNGKISKYAYVYSGNNEAIEKGDVVLVDGTAGEYIVHSGNGGNQTNPLVLVTSTVDSTTTLNATASSLTFVRRDEQDTDGDEVDQLIRRLADDFHRTRIQ